MADREELTGMIADVVTGRFFPGVVTIRSGRIESVTEKDVPVDKYILPGLIDAHIHIESSMLTPAQFAAIAVRHGTVATVSDPHEIANVLGEKGIEFMIRNGKEVPFKFFFGVPSCVPATGFESSGAVINASQVARLLEDNQLWYLSEMMNFPGVLFDDPEVVAKLDAARKAGKPVDGHAPGLRGKEAAKYAAAGITTDHECFTLEEAEEKIGYGIKVQIREGSAARNFDDLAPLLKKYPNHVMLCSDDRHPDDLLQGHMNLLIRKAIKLGYDPINVLRACTMNPVNHYGIPVGLLKPGDCGDMVVVNNLEEFRVMETWIDGKKVFDGEKVLFTPPAGDTPNHFRVSRVQPDQLRVPYEGGRLKVIKALEGQLVTERMVTEPHVENGNVTSDTGRDILKVVVLNRYNPSKPAIAFIHGLGLKKGAIASTVAHDSHNIIAAGTSDEDLALAINRLIDSKGGIAAVSGKQISLLPLPVAGIMSDQPGEKVAGAYLALNEFVKELGSPLKAPFMTLSFMALLVIPELKISDKGLFDGKEFKFTSLFEI
ncbi:MAG: adenine deaminase [Bacteroidales bacterium]